MSRPTNVEHSAAVASGRTASRLRLEPDCAPPALLARAEDELRALRRVAILVAHGGEPSRVFAAVTEEMCRCLGASTVGLWRYETTGEISGGGSGLIGLKDRVEALGGQLGVVSPVGGGTSLTATIPLRQL